VRGFPAKQLPNGLVFLAVAWRDEYDRPVSTKGSPALASGRPHQQRLELARLRKENRELRREKDFFKLAAAHFAKEQLPVKGFS